MAWKGSGVRFPSAPLGISRDIGKARTLIWVRVFCCCGVFAMPFVDDVRGSRHMAFCEEQPQTGFVNAERTVDVRSAFTSSVVRGNAPVASVRRRPFVSFRECAIVVDEIFGNGAMVCCSSRQIQSTAELAW